MEIELDWLEFFLWLLYVLVGYTVLFFFKTFSKNQAQMKYIVQGYFIKVVGGLLFSLIYLYIYRGGDTIEYYLGTKELVNIFYEDTSLFFKILGSSNDEINDLLKTSHNYIRYENAADARFMLKISSVFNILSFNTYLGMTFFFSLISFFASLFFSKVMNFLLPNKEKLIFRVNFFIPSVIIWGGGILKDTWTFFCFSILCFLLYKLLEDSKKWFKYLSFAIIPVFIIMELKAYILICFIPWIFISLFFKLIKQSKNPVAKFLFFPYILIFIMLSGSLSSNLIMETSTKYNSDKIIDRVEGFHGYHTYLGGSIYNLGEIEYTQSGLLKKIPSAVNVALFRPYPWETNSVMSFFISLESLFLLIFFIFLFVTMRLKIFRLISSNYYLFGSLIFTLFLAYVVGLTSYNFGALTRFKIPLMPFFVFSLYYVNEIKKRSNVAL